MARGLAAAAVFLQHLRAVLFLDWQQTTAHSPVAAAVYLLAKFGHPAVIVFFVLSGFLVGSSGLRAVKNRTWSLRRYLLHRVLRLEMVLLPALLLGLLWDTIGTRVLGAWALYNGGWHLLVRWSPIDLSWRAFLGNTFFLQDILVAPFGSNTPLWSLSYEFWYYIVFGLLLTAVLGRSRRWLRVVCGVLILPVVWFTGFEIMSLAPLWFMGLGIYLLPRRKLGSTAQRFLLTSSLLLFLAFIGWLFGTRPLHAGVFGQPVLADLFTGLLFSVVLYAMLHANPTGARYRKRAHQLAAPSYTLYANHLPALLVLVAWIGVRQPPTLLRLLELAGWFLVYWLYAYGLYLLFETRTQRVRNWIEPRLFSSL